MFSDNSLVSFRAISTFIFELAELFQSKHRPLKLYKRLIEKTTVAHEKAILSHIETFRKFSVANRGFLCDKKLKESKITYSNKVFIELDVIFRHADNDTSGVIWQHLLTISALVDPAGKAKDMLKQNTTLKNGEKNFINDIIEKVEGHVDPNANPMEAISHIMSSGVLNDLIGGMNEGINNGSIDLGNLMGAVQGMMGGMGGMGDEQMESLKKMIESSK